MEKTYKRVPFDIELANDCRLRGIEFRVVEETIIDRYLASGVEIMTETIAKKFIELPEETPKHEFKPFDKVLVRANNEMCWKPTFYVRTEITEDNKTFYETIGGIYHEQCIPYAGNEHLVGTIDNPK